MPPPLHPPIHPPVHPLSSPLQDTLAAQIGLLRVIGAASCTAASLWPAAWLVSGAPFFWAPPLWVLAMMAPADAKAGTGGNAPR